MSVPAGFDPLPTASPFNNHVGPFYCKVENDALVVGLLVESKHCNTAGMLHGAMFGALADVTLGNNIGLRLAQAADEKMAAAQAVTERRATGAPIATINLAIDYAGTARQGDWVEMHAEVQKLGGTLAYVNGYVQNGSERIGRASGIYRILRRD